MTQPLLWRVDAVAGETAKALFALALLLAASGEYDLAGRVLKDGIVLLEDAAQAEPRPCASI
jgi:hypothetical protein